MIKMIFQRPVEQRRYLLLDIDTQKDFLLAEGKACVQNHSEVLANIRRVIAWSRHRHIPIISIAQVHPNHNGASAITYCLDGTTGQRKISYTLLNNRASFPADDFNALPAELWCSYRQIILHKRCTDPFDEPRIDRLLTEVQADEFFLIGAGTEDAIKATALGLLYRNKNVSIIVDALGSHNDKEARYAVRMIKAKGVSLIATEDLAGNSGLHRVGICKCKTCRKNRYI
jgi:nicotinamidase-related amidase